MNVDLLRNVTNNKASDRPPTNIVLKSTITRGLKRKILKWDTMCTGTKRKVGLNYRAS